ncbi:protein isoform a [Neofusicoccum parvum]|uniref:Protein isoform a n=1 Tax=Neofusicoccum parvum TaxID=310453 RepID=A0ACB5S7L4_9PEZI|nr:protein isoform a [Neofusicoccum parvum]
MSADPARPQSFVADSPPPLSVTPSSPPQQKQQHLELPKSPAMDKNNRLSLDSSLLRRNPFARANQLTISTDAAAAAADVEPGLKSAPPVPDSQQKRHSATFPMAARGFFSFGAPSPPPEEPEEEPPADCNMSEEEMQGLLEHVRKAENDRMRAESELARREKELARVKNELRRAEGEIEELKAQLQQQAQTQQPPPHYHHHQRQPSGGLKPVGGSQEDIHPAYRHDSLDPNTRPGAANGSPVAAESPYRHTGYASSTELTANSNASQQSLRPYSCSAAVPPPRSGFPPSPRLTTRASMISIVEAPRNEESDFTDHDHDHDHDHEGGEEDEGVSPKRRRMRRKNAASEKTKDGKPKEKKSSTRLRERFSRMSFFHDKKKDDLKLDFAAEQ